MNNEEYFLDKDEIYDYIENKMLILINESDRGAVLIGLSQIDLELEKFLLDISPSKMTKKEKSWIERANLSSKINMAYTGRLLPRNIFDAINILKKIRNDVAHNIEVFNLENHKNQLEEVYKLIGENIDMLIHEYALNYLILTGVSTLMTLKDENNKSRFIDKREAWEYLINSKEVLVTLEKNFKLRTKFAITVMFICGLIIYHKDKTRELLKEEKTISSYKENTVRRGES